MKLLVAIFLGLYCAGSALGGDLDLLSQKYDWRSPNRDAQISWHDGKLKITSTRSAGGLYNAVPLNSLENRLLIINLRSARGGIGEISWTTGKKRFSHAQNRLFYPGNGLHYIMLGPEKEPLNHLLIFTGSRPGTAEISEMKLAAGGPLELLLAGWQEFFGPVGREPDGFNFLVIRSPRLFGQPFVLYFNALLCLVLLYALVTGKRRAFLFALLAAWLVMEASSLLNNWIAFERDAKYFSRPLPVKHEMINTPGFYRFLLAADKELPPGASFKLKSPGFYDDIRAQYYLYPRMATTETTNLLDFQEEKWN